MNARKRVLAINGSYRAGGITDQAVDSLIDDLQGLDVEVEHIKLRDFPIRFCMNCRECMQQPGDAPGICIHKDGMAKLIEKIEAADGYILAAPTNFSSVTALFKRFSERLDELATGPGASRHRSSAGRRCRRSPPSSSPRAPLRDGWDACPTAPTRT